MDVEPGVFTDALVFLLARSRGVSRGQMHLPDRAPCDPRRTGCFPKISPTIIPAVRPPRSHRAVRRCVVASSRHASGRRCHHRSFVDGYRFAKPQGESVFYESKKGLPRRHFRDSIGVQGGATFRFDSSRCLNCHSNLTGHDRVISRPFQKRPVGVIGRGGRSRARCS